MAAFAFMCVYGYVVLSNASYLLTMGQALQSAVAALAPSYTFCLPQAAAYTCAFLVRDMAMYNVKPNAKTKASAKAKANAKATAKVNDNAKPKANAVVNAFGFSLGL